MDDETRPFEALEAQLLPDDQQRVFVILFRLPTELPLHNRDSWTPHLPGDLGEGWDIEAEMSPVEGFVPIVANLRQPYASCCDA